MASRPFTFALPPQASVSVLKLSTFCIIGCLATVHFCPATASFSFCTNTLYFLHHCRHWRPEQGNSRLCCQRTQTATRRAASLRLGSATVASSLISHGRTKSAFPVTDCTSPGLRAKPNFQHGRSGLHGRPKPLQARRWTARACFLPSGAPPSRHVATARVCRYCSWSIPALPATTTCHAKKM